MLLSRIWGLILVLSLLCSYHFGTFLQAVSGALDGAQSAVTLCISMAGTLCLWTGLLEVFRSAGWLNLLSQRLRRPLCHLLPQAARDPETLSALSANVTANLFGLGNAATPSGIRAACRMAEGCHGTASNELCRLVVLNTASIQLIPTTVASLRAAAGAAEPFDILPAVWLTSLLSVSSGLIVARLLEHVEGITV